MKTLLCFLFIVLLTNFSIACTGGTNAGSLSPTAAYQTQSVSNGQYYVINVTCGSIYNFTFCSNGGSASWDTQITINQTNNTTQLAYNDDACGLQSNVSWTATFNGTIHVLISQYSCNNSGGNSGILAYNVTETSVTYNASCTTASTNITGDTAGTFSFNPVPTDGATINSATGEITNATEAASYTVEYTYCGGTITIPVTMGTAPCWTLNGDGQYITVNGEQCIQLTDEINNQTGCAWNGSQIDFASNFTLTLDYYFGNNIGGADGNTFTFQPSSSTACGQAGGQLGAGGLSNALTIEFDTYDNDNPTHLYDMACDHIAVEIDGNMQGAAPYCGPVCAKPGGQNIDDGGTYTVEIAWNATTQQLDIYFDGNLRLSCNGDFVNTVFGGQSQVYWGATSATGGLNNQQYFCPSTVVVLPVELNSFESTCDEDGELFTWTTSSENRADYFRLEYTHDGLLFFPVGTVDAVGNSFQENKYELFVTASDSKQRYYRLKCVDDDGNYEYTDIISSRNCHSFSLINSIVQNEDRIVISLNENSFVSMANSMGQLIENPITESKFVTIPTNKLSPGVYIILAENADGEFDSRKIIIH